MVPWGIEGIDDPPKTMDHYERKTAMSHWKHVLAALAIAGASGAAVASDTTPVETSYGSDQVASTSGADTGQTSSERTESQETQTTSSEGEAG